MKNSRLVALSGVCSALATLCLVGATYFSWGEVVFAVAAAVAVSTPLLVDGKNGLYSFLTYLASSVIGMFLGVSNALYSAPIVAFAMPAAMWKAFCESKREDGSRRVKAIWQWVVYFALCECAVALTALAVWAFTPDVFETIRSGKWYLLVALANVAVPLYHFLMRGVFFFARKAISKSGVR